ncbi:MAG: hypothetical protein LBG62_04590 [Candidatus Methanoplasma sp.]|jgi:hypothetical protein|nr:hypothetical protein [Candidatus Methanoplasma sp.]
MDILGLSDPYIIAAYAGCFLTVALCVAWALLSGGDGERPRLFKRGGGKR